MIKRGFLVLISIVLTVEFKNECIGFKDCICMHIYYIWTLAQEKKSYYVPWGNSTLNQKI